MTNQTPRLGFDRFMALRWVNMALELRLLNQDPDRAFHLLKEWLTKEISGKETARKTATQTRRLWFAKHDQYNDLRRKVFDNGLAEKQAYWQLLHFGLSLNVFPLFLDVCQITGRLLSLQGTCQRKDVHQRVREKYGNPGSTRTATDRVFQTLLDWGLLIDRNGWISAPGISVENTKLIEWLILSLISARSVNKLPFVDGINAPELLGVRFKNVRSAIHSSLYLQIERTIDSELLTKTS